MNQKSILDPIQFEIDDSQRQLVLLALHKLRAERPGWSFAVAEVETALGGQIYWPPESDATAKLLEGCERALAALQAVQAAMEHCPPAYELPPIPLLRAAIADAKQLPVAATSAPPLPAETCEIITELSFMLSEAHDPELKCNHHGDDSCSYCDAIARADAFLAAHGAGSEAPR